MKASGVESLEEAQRVYESIIKDQREPRAAVDAEAPPLDRAQDLAYEAMSAGGRRQIQLARRALTISRDCADAWAVLALRTRSLPKAISLYREAVAAGERALGPEVFEREAGHFWGLVDTRPYMRATIALAQCLDEEGSTDEAVHHYRELLRLNPVDNQAARQPLLMCLLAANRDAEAQALIDQFAEDDDRPDWHYGAALVAFRMTGDSEAARERLARALARNGHAAPFLTGEREIPELAAAYRFGSVEEAAIAADWLLDAWAETPGAVYWLNTERRQAKKAARSERRPKPGRPRGR